MCLYYSHWLNPYPTLTFPVLARQQLVVISNEVHLAAKLHTRTKSGWGDVYIEIGSRKTSRKKESGIKYGNLKVLNILTINLSFLTSSESI